ARPGNPLPRPPPGARLPAMPHRDAEALRARWMRAGRAIAALLPLLALPAAAGAKRGVLFDAPFLCNRTGNEPRAAAIGDLDGDGHPDLVVANSASNSLTLLFGIGDGRFGNGRFGVRLELAAGSRPRALAVADLDRDGALDIVAANSGSNTVSVWRGRGGGGFGAGPDPRPGPAPEAVPAARLAGGG